MSLSRWSSSIAFALFVSATALATHVHATVGAIAGQHDVGNDGSAQYSIPVSTPAGIQGVQPKIALSYSSNGGNGLVGVGFDISGLSSIHRCETTIVRDGFRDGVDFDDNDQFCLDGQRLVAVSGTYGADGTEYRTEFDSITKVVSYGVENTANNPLWFRAWTSDGLVHDYGVDDQSRSSKTSTYFGCPAGYIHVYVPEYSIDFCMHETTHEVVPRVEITLQQTYDWSIAQTADRYNNRATYSYFDDDINGEYRIERIDYNYSSGTAKNSVRFTYENRPDTATGFFAGSPIRQTQRLKAIASYAVNTKLRELQLTYTISAVTGDSRITSVTECAGGQCVSPTTFSWEAGQAGFSATAVNSGNSAGGWNRNPLVMDVNGDGKQDLVQAGSSSWEIMLSTGSTFTSLSFTNGSSANWAYAKPFRYDDDLLEDILTVLNGRWYVLKSIVTQPQTVTFTYLGQSYQVTIPGGPNFTPVDTGIVASNPGTAQLMDVDGDGRKDLLYVRSGVTYVRFLSSLGFGAEQATNLPDLSYTYALDLNSDGQTDLLKDTSSSMSGYISQGTNIFEIVNFGTAGAGDHGKKILDMNGDGLPDLLYRQNQQQWIRINTGNNFGPATLASSLDLGSSGFTNAIPFDYNADGRTDLLYASGSTWHVLISNGATFVSQNTGIPYAGWNANPLTGDIAGNGMEDLILNISNTWQVRSHNNLRPDYLTQIQNGMGVQTKFSYRFLTDPSDPDFYDQGAPATYPLINVQNASYLVSRVEQSNGLAGAGMNSTDYRYKRLLMHQQGLGNLGFEEVTTINNDTNIRTVAKFSHEYANQKHGTLVQMSTVNQTNTALLSHTTNTWDVVTMGTGVNRRYVRGVKTTTVSKRDLNGAFLHKEETTNPTPYEIYYLGNSAVRTQVSKVYGASDNLLRTETISSKYTNNPANWIMGLLTESTVNSALVGGGVVPDRSSGFTYDLTTGRKMTEFVRKASGGGTDIHRISYGLNALGQTQVNIFGRNLAMTLSGPDFASRTSHVTSDPTGRYLTSETNALGQVTTHNYYGDTHINAGLVHITTDPNGLKTRYTYDPFGRLLTTTSLYDTANAVTTTTSYNSCTGANPACPANTAYYVRVLGSDGSDSRTYLDKLGRTLREATLGFGSGQWVKVDYQYNTRGDNTHVSEPYITGSPLWNTTTYDVLGRPTQRVDANSRTDTVAYSGLTTTSRMDTTGKNQQKVEVRDSLGNLIQVTDNAGKITTYSYDAYGQMTSLTPPAVPGLTVQSTTIVYDELGRKVSMSDPDKGVWHYTYNMLGELITQKDAKNQVTCMAYDVLGRMTKRADLYAGSVSTDIAQVSQSTNGCAGHAPANTSTWVYDTASGAGKGQLHQVISPSYSKVMVYDNFGRNTQVTEQVSGASYTTGMTYDSKSRLDVLTYPGPSNRLAVKHVYNSQGYLTHLRNNATNALYYQVTALDARGNVTNETHGNGLTTTRAYQASTGFLQSVNTGNTPINNRQNLSFAFDKLGNLTSRTDTLKNFAETFTYDNLNRLTGTSANFGNGQLQITALTYDALGNILTKTGVGTYQYGSQCGAGNRMHAVCQITGGSVGTKNATYSYDANGNMTAGDGRTITWSAFDKPTAISQGSNSTTMTYGPDRQLLSRTDNNGGQTTSTLHIGNLYERVILPDSTVEERHTVGGNTLVTYTNRTTGSAGTVKTRYLHKDHLGSITVITNESGVEVESFSFDPWGKRRAPSLAQLEVILGNWSLLDSYQKGNLTIPSLTLTSVTTQKGFTGHKQLDGVGLIHMGGRVYDAEIGRFLSADPFVQDTSNLQGLNRYSYVENNPLSYTDPSGYFLKKLVEGIGKAIKSTVSATIRFERDLRRKILRTIGKVEGLSTIITVALNFIPGCQAWCSMAFNASMTDANGGTIGQVLSGAAVGYVMYGSESWGGMVGEITKNASNFARSGVNLVAGGVSAKAMGGKFIDGVKGAATGMGLTAVGVGIKESYQFKTNLVSELANEFRIMFATKPPAQSFRQSYTAVEQVGGGVPMAVSAPEAIVSPQLFYRAAPMARGGGIQYVGGSNYGVVGLHRGQNVARWAINSIGTTSLIGVAPSVLSLPTIGAGLRIYGNYGIASAYYDAIRNPGVGNFTRLGVTLFSGGLAHSAGNTIGAMTVSTFVTETVNRIPFEQGK